MQICHNDEVSSEGFRDLKYQRPWRGPLELLESTFFRKEQIGFYQLVQYWLIQLSGRLFLRAMGQYLRRIHLTFRQ